MREIGNVRVSRSVRAQRYRCSTDARENVSQVRCPYSRLTTSLYYSFCWNGRLSHRMNTLESQEFQLVSSVRKNWLRIKLLKASTIDNRCDESTTKLRLFFEDSQVFSIERKNRSGLFNGASLDTQTVNWSSKRKLLPVSRVKLLLSRLDLSMEKWKTDTKDD